MSVAARGVRASARARGAHRAPVGGDRTRRACRDQRAARSRRASAAGPHRRWPLCALALGAARTFAPAPRGLAGGRAGRERAGVRSPCGSRTARACSSRPSRSCGCSPTGRSAIELELRSGSARFDVTHDAPRAGSRSRPARRRCAWSARASRSSARRRARACRCSVSVSEGTVEVRAARSRAGEPQRHPRRRELERADPGRGRSRRATCELAKVSEAAERAGAERRSSRIEAEADPTEVIEPASDRTQERPRARTRPGRRVCDRRVPARQPGRRAGRMREAADAYAALLASYPDDARAGLSAFELGRIRMDALDDEAGAIEALERSLAAGTAASFHEDALARIVVAQRCPGPHRRLPPRARALPRAPTRAACTRTRSPHAAGECAGRCGVHRGGPS